MYIIPIILMNDMICFRLGLPCGKQVRLIVESLNEDATEISLTEESIETTVRSRLRSARIYDDESLPYIYVNVNVVGQAFHIGISLNQLLLKPPIMDLKTEQEVYPASVFPATTWNIGGSGTHGSDAGYILQAIAQYTDKFIDEYFRVNEKVCSKSD